VGNSPYSSYAAFAGDPSFIDYDDLPDTEGYYDFIKENDYWLHDYIAFNLLKEMNDKKPWYKWPEKYRNADSLAIVNSLTDEQKVKASKLVGEQYCFYAQWKEVQILSGFQKFIQGIRDFFNMIRDFFLNLFR
jgi:4-alpha-glucanotransferase